MSELKMLSIDQAGIITQLDRNGYKKMGVAIKTASSYAEAQRILNEQKIDFIVINYDNEKVNTAAMCEHFKRSPNTKDVLVVITSVQNVGKQLKDRHKVQFDLFVEQPVPRQYFIEKVRALLDQKTRKTDRIPLKQGYVAVNTGDGVISCILEDVSQTGILVNSEVPLEIDKEVAVSFTVPAYKKPIIGKGIVVRKISSRNKSHASAGYGIRFIDFEGDSQTRLVSYINKTQSDDPKLVYYL